jgi:hypothetical protein
VSEEVLLRLRFSDEEIPQIVALARDHVQVKEFPRVGR